MDDQQDLWHDTLEDAVRAAVDAVGGPKRVASQLWPAKSLADARRYLLHCLDESRAEKLSLGEVEMIGTWARACGCHVLMAYLAKTWGYSAPQPVEPEDERAQLQRAYIQAVEQLTALAGRIEEVSKPRAVK